jgi:hypothetical protein
VAQPIFYENLFTLEKIGSKILTACYFSENPPQENNRPIGENWTNLDTLLRLHRSQTPVQFSGDRLGSRFWRPFLQI